MEMVMGRCIMLCRDDSDSSPLRLCHAHRGSALHKIDLWSLTHSCRRAWCIDPPEAAAACAACGVQAILSAIGDRVLVCSPACDLLRSSELQQQLSPVYSQG